MKWGVGCQMRIPNRPHSWALRLVVAAAGLWLAFSAAFVILNRYSYGADWDGLEDFILLLVGPPIGLLGIVVAFWSLRAKVFFVLAAVAILVTVASTFPERSLKAHVASPALMSFGMSRAELETKHGAACAEEKKSENPYAYNVCLRAEEHNSSKVR